MFSAIWADLARIHGIEVITLADGAGTLSGFRELAGMADYTLVIAPESGGELLRRCEWVRQAGGKLLGPDPEAVALTADKLATSQHLEHRGVPTPPTWALTPEEDIPLLPLPAVMKPRYGAGSQDLNLVHDPDTWKPALAMARASGEQFVVQRFVPGLAASVAFLVGPGETLALPPARQLLSDDGRFHYQGGEIPLPRALAQRAEALARRALSTIPGLRGFVGVDIVLGQRADGDHVIEVNPRLTTSYVGLRALAEQNLAHVMLRVVEGAPVPPPTWRPGRIRFGSTGNVLHSVP